jgi:hypothetical protein
MNRKELKAMEFLRFNKDIRIFQADKGDFTVVFDESQ